VKSIAVVVIVVVFLVLVFLVYEDGSGGRKWEVQSSYTDHLLVRVQSMPQRRVQRNNAEENRTEAQLTMKAYRYPDMNKGRQAPAFWTCSESCVTQYTIQRSSSVA
jgi:hypothetical protein